MEGLKDETFSQVLSTVMIQFLHNGQGVIEEVYRILQPSDILGLGIWDEENDVFVGWGKACRTVDPSYEVPKSKDENGWYSVLKLENASKKVGSRDVRSDIVRVKFEQGIRRRRDFWVFGLRADPKCGVADLCATKDQ